jgi:hypothetical protein
VSDGGDGGGDGDPPPVFDRDADGVLDVLDNCADRPNPDQANEDGDGSGDACDPCPGLPTLLQRDLDRDGVGDECDPRPGVAGERIAVFETFAAGVPAGWIAIGSWVADGKGVRGQAGAEPATLVAPGATGAQLSVWTEAVLRAGAGPIGPVDRASATGDVGIHCGATGARLGLFGATGAEISAASLAAPLGEPVRLTYTGDRGYLSCRGRAGIGNETFVGRTLAIAGPGAQVGLRVASGTASFSWLMVISSQ